MASSSPETTPAIVVTNHDPVYLEMVQEFLLDAGYSLVFCVSADTAWETVRRELPGVVLVDISIQNPQHGWTMVDMMRLYPQTATIPVIICSTDPELPSRKADRLARLNCQFLEKPFMLEQLLRVITATIGPPSSGGAGQGGG